MTTTLDLGQMDTSEKPRLMEDRWQNLSRDEQNVPSPSWHGEILSKRERLISSGEEAYIDWEVAKKQLREELQ